LTGFCGLAIGSAELPERWQRNAVSLGGPGAGFLLAAVFAGLCWLYDPALTLWALARLVGIPVDLEVVAPLLLRQIVYTMLVVNVFWGLVNLLPIWPLDG